MYTRRIQTHTEEDRQIITHKHRHTDTQLNWIYIYKHTKADICEHLHVCLCARASTQTHKDRKRHKERQRQRELTQPVMHLLQAESCYSWVVPCFLHPSNFGALQPALQQVPGVS